MRLWTVLSWFTVLLLLVAGALSAVGGWQWNRQMPEHSRARLAEIPLDLSRAGDTYEGAIDVAWERPAGAILLEVETERSYATPAAARRALTGTEIVLTTPAGADLRPALKWPLTEREATARAAPGGGYHPAYGGIFGVCRKGANPVKLRVVKPARRLAEVPHSLIARYEISAVEATWEALMIGKGVMLVVGALAWVFAPMILRRRRRQLAERLGPETE